MPAGLQVFTDSGAIQIDEEYRNFVYDGTGFATAQPINGGPAIQYLTLAANSLLAIRTTNGPSSDGYSAYACAQPISFANGQIQYRFISGTQNTPIQWYAFRLSNPSDSLGYGMDVFNSAGEMVFTSSRPPLRVLKHVMTDQSNVNFDDTFEGKVVAAVSGKLATGISTVPRPDNELWSLIMLSGFAFPNPSRCQYGMRPAMAQAQPTGSAAANPGMTYMVIDVTGF